MICLCVWIWWNLHNINYAGDSMELFSFSPYCILQSFEFVERFLALSHLQLHTKNQDF